MSESDSIRLDKVVMSPGRMRLEVSLAFWAPRTTDAATAKEAVAKYPTILAHSCINSEGPSFGDVIANTSVPHLLEHMIIEEQLAQAEQPSTAQALPVASAAQGATPAAVGGAAAQSGTLVGTTRMAKDGKRAVIEVSFFDDIVAARAAARALDELNAMLPCRPYLY